MLENELLQFIGNVGSPIAITVYLLFSRDKIIQTNTEALKQLNATVKDLKEIIIFYHQRYK